MYHMRLGEGDGYEIVNMSGKASEAGLITHEAMNVHEQ